MSTPLIIGIHGLNNKPRPDTLKRWWMASLIEGCQRNLAEPPRLAEFQLAYWADLNHPVPYSVANDPEPYLPASGNGPMAGARTGRRRALSALGLEAAGKVLEAMASSRFLEERLESLIETRANDLYRYQTEREFRHALRSRLQRRLLKAQGRPVMLVAHSMGSIIAYDVLRQDPALSVSHLVTIGSPLGLSEVKQHSSLEFGAARIPDGVAQWTNLADPRDRIAALDLRLASDYASGPACERIVDCQVRNEYVGPLGKPNPHKVYGYLRTPEVSALLAGWLAAIRRRSEETRCDAC